MVNIIRKIFGVKYYCFTCTSGYKGDMSVTCVVSARDYEQAKYKLHKRLEKCGIILMGNYISDVEVV